jgi:hypothetical protein
MGSIFFISHGISHPKASFKSASGLPGNRLHLQPIACWGGPEADLKEALGRLSDGVWGASPSVRRILLVVGTT